MSAKRTLLQAARGLSRGGLCGDLAQSVLAYFLGHGVRAQLAQRLLRLAKWLVGTEMLYSVGECIDLLEKGLGEQLCRWICQDTLYVCVLRRSYPALHMSLADDATIEKLLPHMQRWLLQWPYSPPSTSKCLACGAFVVHFFFCSACHSIRELSETACALEILEERRAKDSTRPLLSTYLRKHCLRLSLTNTGSDIYLTIRQVDPQPLSSAMDDALRVEIENEFEPPPKRQCLGTPPRTPGSDWDATPRIGTYADATPRRSATP